MFELEIDGKTQKVRALKRGETLWLHYQGRTITYTPEKKSRSAGAGASHFGTLKSPMPGKVIKVLVQSGQEVKAKQTLLVMEAMKMEYSIKAGEDAKIGQIFCKEGEQLKESQNLIEVLPIKKG